MIARKFFVEGKVQGVLFRDAAVNKARELGVTGWVRNRKDGRLEVYAVGPTVALDRFTDFLRVGPPGARVDRMDRADALIEQFATFTRRRTV